MKEAEFTYSLYVQANPVPDPDLLPLARDEATLLSFERSPDMMSEEQTDKARQGSPSRPSRLVAAIGAAAVLVLAIAAVALVAGGDTTLVAAGEADPVMEFDGSVCSYSGPERIEEGIVEFSMTNLSDSTVAFANIRLQESDLADELDGLPVGSSSSDVSPTPSIGTMRFTQVLSGESLTKEMAMPSGFYLLDCATGVPTDHVWRAAQIEVVEP